jgi:glycosyltransferase involved in cell wall biosynthesis
LFLDQGRAVTNAAMGHVRVQHALAAGLTADALLPGEVVSHVEVPPFERWERVLARSQPFLGKWNFGSVRWHLMRSWSARRIIRRELRADPPAVVHITTDQVGLTLGRTRRRVPCVLSLDVTTIDWVRMKRALPLDQSPPFYLRPLEVLERRALRRAPLSVAWTQTVADRIAALQPRARVTIVHPGLDLAPFSQPRRATTDGPLRVLFIGGRWVAKGGPALVAALGHRLGDTVALDVVTTENLPPQDGIQVHRAEPGSSDIPNLLAQADVFCLPTLVDAVPWVVLEAMAAGVPVVATRVGSIPEMLAADTATPCGIVVPPGDADALQSALDTVLTDAELRLRLGAAGRERTRSQYDARVNAPQLLSVLRDLTREAG